MTLKRLKDIPRWPRKVIVFCANRDPNNLGTTRSGKPCDGDAEVWLVSDDVAVSPLCRKCAERDLLHLPGEWTTAPIFHDCLDKPNNSIPRT